MKLLVTEKQYIKQSIEITIRLVLIFVLLWYCFNIISPFISSLLWAIISAVAIYPLFEWIKEKTKMSNTSTAISITVFALFLFVIPFYLLLTVLTNEFYFIASELNKNVIEIPTLPQEIGNWPVVGKKINTFWNMASKNIDLFVTTYDTQISAIGTWLLQTMISLVSGIFNFILSIFFMGILLAYSTQIAIIANKFFIRIAGKEGEAFSTIVQKTIMSVTKGVLGVAFIQSALAAIGFFAVGMPGAGIATLLCVMLSTMQIGLIPVIIPVLIYAFYTYSTLVASILCAWLILVSLIDNILKPVLLGKGSPVPMPVIFIGVIGGFLSFGILGMFIGSVLFSLGYILFLVWLNEPTTIAARKSRLKN
jgi:predicted PurR-regulated permease PerM